MSIPPFRSALIASALVVTGLSSLAQARAESAIVAAQDPKQDARALEEKGAVSEARDAWLVAGMRVPPGAEREECVARSRALDMRLALRREILDAFPRDKPAFAELGVQSVDERSFILSSGAVAWHEVSLDLLSRAALLVKASQQARAGLAFEFLARGKPGEKEQGLAQLGRLLDRKEIAPNDAFAAVARARNEAVPPRGYAFKDGKWFDVDRRERVTIANDHEELAKSFEVAPATMRDELFQRLVAEGAPEAERLAHGLATRWNNAIALLNRGSTLRDLQALAAQRAELDQRREAALKLIFDEDEYFYPYNPPECPPEKARLYAGVQQRVDELVSKVRETWKASKKARISSTFKEAIDEIEWNKVRQAEIKLSFAMPPEVPAWIGAVETGLDTLDLSTFAKDDKERAALARDRAVNALNQRQFKSNAFTGAQVAGTDEQKEIALTNNYRQLLGRCVLAWNPKLQASAQLHSDYMSTSGDFGHEETDPARRWPEDRMRLAGYKKGAGENCAMDGGAEGAHLGWLHSSGHHRNILAESHREMGAGQSGLYWTQNFGSGNEFESEIAKANQ